MKKLATLLLALLLSLQTLSAFAGYDEPLFVTITSDCCSTCQKLKPVVEDLEYDYGSQVTFLTLDVSTRNSIEESRQKANEYGIGNFFEKNLGAVPRVAILCPGGEKVDKTFLGEIRKEIYRQALDELLLDTTKVCSL